jgi:RNA polymerase-binding transcription factor DksA
MSAEDKAQEQEVLEWARNNIRREIATYTPADPRYGPSHCHDCGEQMPVLRREAGRTLCTPCQTEIEATSKFFKR